MIRVCVSRFEGSKAGLPQSWHTLNLKTRTIISLSFFSSNFSSLLPSKPTHSTVLKHQISEKLQLYQAWGYGVQESRKVEYFQTPLDASLLINTCPWFNFVVYGFHIKVFWLHRDLHQTLKINGGRRESRKAMGKMIRGQDRVWFGQKQMALNWNSVSFTDTSQHLYSSLFYPPDFCMFAPSRWH